VRNWALISNGRPMFMTGAKPDPNFTPQERESTTRAAGQVIELIEKDAPRPYNARTGVTRPSHGLTTPRWKVRPLRAFSPLARRSRLDGVADQSRCRQLYVRSWWKSGSRFRATGGPFVTKPGHSTPLL
jgi:hypothetical protein